MVVVIVSLGEWAIGYNDKCSRLVDTWSVGPSTETAAHNDNRSKLLVAGSCRSFPQDSSVEFSFMR